MWKEVPRTRKKELLSSHLVESSRPSITIVRLEVQASECYELTKVKKYFSFLVYILNFQES